ncbi:hypothetical protein BB561_006089 [Smittium simulii]|uniref:Uncharacterized protein n=1 Tax=Smittium simulii TaxID=133385 RepID=A0A2T9Y6L8_9FUNG|nr:hypothetical protein BB561_006089 [Smittium simulii]
MNIKHARSSSKPKNTVIEYSLDARTSASLKNINALKDTPSLKKQNLEYTDDDSNLSARQNLEYTDDDSNLSARQNLEYTDDDSNKSARQNSGSASIKKLKYSTQDIKHSNKSGLYQKTNSTNHSSTLWTELPDSTTCGILEEEQRVFSEFTSLENSNSNGEYKQVFSSGSSDFEDSLGYTIDSQKTFKNYGKSTRFYNRIRSDTEKPKTKVKKWPSILKLQNLALNNSKLYYKLSVINSDGDDLENKSNITRKSINKSRTKCGFGTSDDSTLDHFYDNGYIFDQYTLSIISNKRLKSKEISKDGKVESKTYYKNKYGFNEDDIEALL